MKTLGTRAILLACGIALIACAPASTPDDPATGEAAEEANETVAFTKKVMVLGVPIYATNTTRDEKLLHAAGVLAQFLDNDEDGEPDNPKVHQAILDTGCRVLCRTGTTREPR